MHYICPLCERSSEKGNLWCQEPNCPAEAIPQIMGYGDTLGDVRVVRMMYFLRTAAIYEAQRGDDRLLLKVAHPGAEEQLKREAMLLARLADSPHPALPVLVAPNLQVDVKQVPYSKAMFRTQTKYYSVFEYATGIPLRDALLANPQPWFQHVGWLITSLADALAYLHVKGNVLHLNLSPDRILVRTDLDGIYRPLLLDLGTVWNANEVDRAWAERYLLPAYSAPELFKSDQAIGPSTDVYGLGLLMYEMLTGAPAYEYRLQRDNVVREAVIKASSPTLKRGDLVPEIGAIVNEALDKVPGRRQADIRSFAQQVRKLFGEVPAERKPSRVNRQFVTIAVAIAFTLALATLAFALVG
jgi:serine/threonine protein kinase